MEIFIFYLVVIIGAIVVVLKSLNELQKEYDEKKNNLYKISSGICSYKCPYELNQRVMVCKKDGNIIIIGRIRSISFDYALSWVYTLSIVADGKQKNSYEKNTYYLYSHEIGEKYTVFVEN